MARVVFRHRHVGEGIDPLAGIAVYRDVHTGIAVNRGRVDWIKALALIETPEIFVVEFVNDAPDDGAFVGLDTRHGATTHRRASRETNPVIGKMSRSDQLRGRTSLCHLNEIEVRSVSEIFHTFFPVCTGD